MRFRLDLIEPWVFTSVLMLILALVFIYRGWLRGSNLTEKWVASLSATRRRKFLAALVICLDEVILTFMALVVLPIGGIFLPPLLIILALVLLPLVSIVLFPILVEVLERDGKTLKEHR